MTRLNSTFRSGCKLDNRTIKEEKQAGKANQPRKKSRNFTKQDCSFIDPGKTFVRTCKLFKTTLHERPRQDCKPTSEKAIRAMDVARQSSMEEGLQVQLLPWKEKADNLISSKSKERSPYNDEGKLPIVRGDLSSIDSNGIRNEMKINSCCQHNEGRLGQVNGVGEIEACVRSDNRMQLNAKVNEKSLESMVYSGKSAEMDADSITNGIQCDVQHLKISSNNTKETAATVFENSPVSDLKAGNVDISLVEVGWTLTNRPNPSSLHYNYKDQCVSNAGSGKTVSDETLEEVNLKNSSGDTDDIKKKGIADTNTLDHCAKSTNTSNTCKDRKHSGSDSQTERDCEHIIAIDLKEKNTNDSCKCDDSTGPASHSVIKGRPKRAARSLRSRHDDDFILDVRQIPHKFKDKITSIKKENRKNLLACGKKRKRTQKQDNKELLTEQEKSEKTEKASKLNEVVDEDKYVNVDCVLGVRHDDNNKQQVLVQFTDGTSNWIKKSEMKSPVNTLSDYFLFADQDLSAAQRLPSAWFGCHLDSWENRPLKLSDFGDCDFYQANGKKLIKCEKSKDYCSKISKRWPAQNIPSPLREASKDSFYLEDRFESIFDMDEKIVNQLAGERLLSNMYFSQSNRVVDCDRIPSNPIGLDSLTSSDQLNLKNDENLFQIDELSDCEPVYCKKVEEVSRPIKPRLSCRSSTTILSDGVQVFLSRNGEVEVLQSDHVEIVLRHKDKRSKRIRSETCDNLIHQLELRINDDECQFVVINGLEDYFASSMDMEKLIKFPSEAEKTKYDEKMANLRYAAVSFLYLYVSGNVSIPCGIR